MESQKGWKGLEHLEHFGTFWNILEHTSLIARAQKWVNIVFSTNHNGAAHPKRKWVTQGTPLSLQFFGYLIQHLEVREVSRIFHNFFFSRFQFSGLC